MVIGYHAVLSRHFIVGGEIFEVDDYSQMQRVKTFSSADEKSCKILHSRNFLCQLKTSTDDSPGGYCRMQRVEKNSAIDKIWCKILHSRNFLCQFTTSTDGIVP